MCPQWKCPMSLHMTFCKTLEPSESSHSNLPQYYSSTNKLISNTRLANRLQPQQPSLWHVNTSNCMSLISSSSFKLSWWSLSSPWLYYTTSAYDNMMNMGVVKQALITLPKLYCHNHHNMRFDANLYILLFRRVDCWLFFFLRSWGAKLQLLNNKLYIYIIIGTGNQSLYRTN